MSISLREAWCKVAEWCENPPWITLDDLPEDLDQQNLDIDCDAGELTISNGQGVPLTALGTKRIYRWKPTDPGLRARWWGPDAGQHLDPLEWDGPADPVSGFPLPSPAAPDFDVINTSSNVNDSNSGAGQARYGIISGWVRIPAGHTLIRDNNSNTGELGMVLLGTCCSNLSEQPGGNHDTNTATADRGLMDPSPVEPDSWVFVYSPHSDLSAFSGLDLETSPDGAAWSEATVTQPEMPEIEFEDIAACIEEIPEGWQEEPLSACCQPMYFADGGLDSEEVQALIDASAVVLSDDDPEPVGLVADSGTSIEAARADHVHEPLPDCPLIEYDDARPVLVGPATELQNSNFRRVSTDRIVEMSYRVRFLADSTASGWVYLQAVTPPGFQLMEFSCRGVYYQTGSQDVNDAGTTPYEEQYMGGNGVEWINGRLYYLHFSATRKFEDVNAYAHVVARYKKVI